MTTVTAQIYFGDDEPLMVKELKTTKSRRTPAETTKPPSIYLSKTTKAKTVKPTTTTTATQPPTVIEGLEGRIRSRDEINFGEENIDQRIGLTVTSQPEAPQCQLNETYFESVHSCVGILTQGPCPNGTWVVINEQTLSPECVPRPSECATRKSETCAKAALKLREKLNPMLTKLACETSKNMQLAFTATGEVICICRKGHVYWAPEERCYAALERGPCRPDEYIHVVKTTKPQATNKQVPTKTTTVLASTTETTTSPLKTTKQRGTTRNSIGKVTTPLATTLFRTTMKATTAPTTQKRARIGRDVTAQLATTRARTTVGVRKRNFDEIDNTDLPFMHKIPIKSNATSNSSITNVPQSKTPMGAKTRNFDEIDNTDLPFMHRIPIKSNATNANVPLKNTTVSIKTRHLDEIDNTNLPFMHRIPIKLNTTNSSGTANGSRSNTTVGVKTRHLDEIDNTNLPFMHRIPIKANTTNSSSIVNVPLTNTTMGIKTRHMDEIDNTDLPFMHRIPINSDTTNSSSTTNEAFINGTASTNQTTDGETSESDGYTEGREIKCIQNICPEGMLPIDLNKLAESSTSNTLPTLNLDDTIIFSDDMEMSPALSDPSVSLSREGRIVCDKIGSEKYCKTGFVLDINLGTLEPDCRGLNDRSSFDSVPLIACPRGYSPDSEGNCAKKIRFGG